MAKRGPVGVIATGSFKGFACSGNLCEVFLGKRLLSLLCASTFSQARPVELSSGGNLKSFALQAFLPPGLIDFFTIGAMVFWRCRMIVGHGPCPALKLFFQTRQKVRRIIDILTGIKSVF